MSATERRCVDDPLLLFCALPSLGEHPVAGDGGSQSVDVQLLTFLHCR